MDAFDSVFAKSAEVKGTVRRKLDNGQTRTARLDNAKGVGLTLAEFADAAKTGATLGVRAEDRGATLSKSAKVSGAAARSAILAMGDKDDTRKDKMPEEEKEGAAK